MGEGLEPFFTGEAAEETEAEARPEAGRNIRKRFPFFCPHFAAIYGSVPLCSLPDSGSGLETVLVGAPSA